MSERDGGSVTLWSLGLAVIVLGLGALSLDLWAVLAARQELLALADAVSIAAASGIDEEALRDDGAVVLDPVSAAQRAHEAMGRQDLPPELDRWQLDVLPDRVAIVVEGHVRGVLLPLLGFDGLDVSVSSESEPLLRS